MNLKTFTIDLDTHAIVPINLLSAIEKLIKCKGRFHTEQNFKAFESAYTEFAVAPPYPDQSVTVNAMVWIPCSERLPDTSRKVIAYYKNEYGKDRQVMAFYAGKFAVESGSDDEYMEYCEGDDAYYLPAGWHEAIENWDDYSSVVISCEITHWKERDVYPGRRIDEQN